MKQSLKEWAGNHPFVAGLCIFGGLMTGLISVVGTVATIYMRTQNCQYPGCDKLYSEYSDQGHYCFEHNAVIRAQREGPVQPRQETEPEYKVRVDYSPTLPSDQTSTSGSSSTSSGSSGSSSSGHHHSSGSSHVYNDLINDPADYDDPEEYADDADGVDFDSWDEAYDYWEDY